MATMGAAFVTSVDTVKQPPGSLSGKKIRVRMGCCQMLRRWWVLMRMPEFKVFLDPLDDAGIVDKAENTNSAAALGESQRIRKMHFANQTRPGAA
jgi:hypothetical protein